MRDRLDLANRNAESSGRWQPKASAAYSPWSRLPLTVHANYGRGISSVDARSILTNRNGVKLATTDFSQVGVSTRWDRFAVAIDGFLINRSNELVYVADDGTLEFAGPSRAYGWEGKTSVEITHHLSFSGGITKVTNAFYRGTSPRTYVDRAPHFVANAGLTLAGWKGWSASTRMRAINGYRLDGADAAIRGAGHTVFDFSVVRRLRRNIDFNFAIDNLLDRAYYETQNYIESRPFRDGPAGFGIHATPGYGRTITVGITARFGGK